MKERENSKSRFLSLVLRHKPEAVGISLEDGGWVRVDTLLDAMKKHGKYLSKEELKDIVFNNDKKRFAFDEREVKIRAVQGHSLDIEMNYFPVEPPAELFHGTSQQVKRKILEEGIRRMNRKYVHLSKEKETAIAVGKRHGSPVVLTVLAGQMHNDGYTFFRADNGVWLTESVPSKYLRVSL
jgi:putative RNA 2'-phosphotransferase